MNQHEQNAYDYPEGHYLRLPKPTDKRGLYKKFTVTRTDGKAKPGAKYFVLDYANDFHARAALRAYIESCGRGDKKDAVLAADLKAALEACGDRGPGARSDSPSRRGRWLVSDLCHRREPSLPVVLDADGICRVCLLIEERDRYMGLVDGFIRSSGPYRLYHWTDDLRHADECDCDLDDEYIGDRCMANSDWTYGVCDDGGSLPPRLIVKLPRHLPESCGECDAVPLLTVPGCDHG